MQKQHNQHMHEWLLRSRPHLMAPGRERPDACLRHSLAAFARCFFSSTALRSRRICSMRVCSLSRSCPADGSLPAAVEHACPMAVLSSHFE